jgi:translation initiation factor 2B subunit (eIF-2B alpha/beta/delta family)
MSGRSNEVDQVRHQARERRPSEKVVQLGQNSFSVQPVISVVLHTSTAEATQAKEHARQEASKRAEQRKNKKAVLQQKAAQRVQAGGKNSRKGKLGFCFAVLCAHHWI